MNQQWKNCLLRKLISMAIKNSFLKDSNTTVETRYISMNRHAEKSVHYTRGKCKDQKDVATVNRTRGLKIFSLALSQLSYCDISC